MAGIYRRTREPFHFTRAISALCVDLCERLDELAHVDMSRVAVSFAQARSRTLHGLQAKLTPMRFEAGSLTTIRRGRAWTVQRLFSDEREMLYILTFYLPRFLDQSFREKMITIVHELYHISPRFDGDLRRFDGRYHAHSHSQREYDAQMEELVHRYLQRRPPQELYDFLLRDFRRLQRQHGGVMGMQIPIPRLIPLEHSKTA